MVTRRQSLARVAATLGAVTIGRTMPLGAEPPLAPLQPRVETPVHDSAFDPWLEVRADHFAHNVAEIRRRAGGRPIVMEPGALRAMSEAKAVRVHLRQGYGGQPFGLASRSSRRIGA